jgi:PAS domain S-box-containing protein
VFSLDSEARIAWSNSAGAALLGRQIGELTGRDVLETVAPESREGARAALARVRRTGQVETLELVANTADGRRRVAEVSIGPGAGGGWQGIARDVTDRRMRDEERSRAQRLESLGLLAGGVAHDINNVLAGVVGHAQLALIELPAGTPGRPRVERIESEAMRGAELASRMLDYAGRAQLVMAPLDLAETVRRAVTLAETSLPPRTTVVVEAERDLPTIVGDATQLQRVVDNLLRNAAEASPRGEAEIRIVVRRVASVEGVRGSWAGTRPRAAAVLICVKDAGEGMDDETRARAFDPFFSTRKAGRGLGLAATLGIVRGHGGAIAVETAPGDGATFTEALPLSS